MFRGWVGVGGRADESSLLWRRVRFDPESELVDRDVGMESTERREIIRIMDPAVGMPFDVMRLEPIPAGAVERIHRHRDQAIGPRLPPGAHLTARHQPQLVAMRHQSPFNDLTVRGREPARQTPRRATQRCAAANRPTRARPKNQGASTVGRPAPASTRCSIATARSSPTSPASNDRSTQRCRTNRPAAHTRSDATARDTSNRPNRYPTIERHPAPAAHTRILELGDDHRLPRPQRSTLRLTRTEFGIHLTKRPDDHTIQTTYQAPSDTRRSHTHQKPGGNQ